MKAFFSYAHDDSVTVHQVYIQMLNTYPDLKGWIDKYQIVGGDDFIEKIAEGMDSSDKFLVFLSEASIQKPWVTAELHRAIVRDIERGGPSYVVPIKLGPLSKIPAFLEYKHAIDLSRMSPGEGLRAIYSAIKGTPASPPVGAAPNLTWRIVPVPGSPRQIGIIFEAKMGAEEIALEVTFSTPYENCEFAFANTTGVETYTYLELWRPPKWAVRFSSHRLTAGRPLVIFATFPDGVDPKTVRVDLAGWPPDDSGAINQIQPYNFSHIRIGSQG